MPANHGDGGISLGRHDHVSRVGNRSLKYITIKVHGGLAPRAPLPPQPVLFGLGLGLGLGLEEVFVFVSKSENIRVRVRVRVRYVF